MLVPKRDRVASVSGGPLRRAAAACAVLGLHVVAIYALANSHTELLNGFSPPPLQVMLVPEAVAAGELPPPPRVKLEPPQIDLEPPSVPLIELPEPEESTAITVALERKPAADSAPTGVPPLVSEVEYAVAPQPGYPSASRRLREQGLVVLRVLVDERGRAQQLSVHESSGHERLDHAALDAVARAAFKPYIANGLAQRVYVLIPIEFALNRAGHPRG
ncbi:MAG TPA: TonB family protein [Steroidobacteraceae bacterium]|nr:TonB family protein [Steroidobacteraceae bacterium]